ncbi:hypothetical protein LSH36_15g08002 [Paralvinella palmiformis]|uniref:Copper transport protein n=1 Tax=Paralvinella palmiformis TaxID=53620 RepID=A0AAD9KC70_9ANNE|nr:hypothetical protein LSH36_15g08002 [Paralvinella palmiformis]
MIIKCISRKTPLNRCCYWQCTMLHLIQTLMHLVQTTISYALMMIFMLFNGWLCISILIGITVGYLMFGWIAYVNRNINIFDHCP